MNIRLQKGIEMSFLFASHTISCKPIAYFVLAGREAVIYCFLWWTVSGWQNFYKHCKKWNYLRITVENKQTKKTNHHGNWKDKHLHGHKEEAHSYLMSGIHHRNPISSSSRILVFILRLFLILSCTYYFINCKEWCSFGSCGFLCAFC